MYTYNAKDVAHFLDSLATETSESSNADIKTLYTLRAGALLLSVLDDACNALAEKLDGNPGKAELTVTIPVYLGKSSLNGDEPPKIGGSCEG